MSLTHNIIPKRPLDTSKLNSFVSTINNAMFENRGERTYYYWIDGKSTRGFDITIDRDVIKVRNTILSNSYDYELTNKIVQEIEKLTNGVILNEEGEQINVLPLFDNNKIAETEFRDAELIQALSKEHEDIAIYGPIRIVHFGKRLHKVLNLHNGQQLKEEIFNIILNVNYKLPDFEYGNIMQIGNDGEDTKTMKLLTNNTNYIIDKYDYILLNTKKEKPIMITNEILNSMLPSNWTLVDEFTVVAPITDQNEWNKLLENAVKFDLWDNFRKN